MAQHVFHLARWSGVWRSTPGCDALLTLGLHRGSTWPLGTNKNAKCLRVKEAEDDVRRPIHLPPAMAASHRTCSQWIFGTLADHMDSTAAN